METVVANFVTGSTRRETLNGRAYIVAPLTLIVHGVLAGSQGPLYYPPEEISKDPSVWNHVPLVVYHPVVNGQHVSARDPEVLQKQGIGMVLRSKAPGDKLAAEGWFDIEATRRVDNRVLTALEKGEPLELSTGLYTDNEPAQSGATHNGKAYSFIARNYRPDHVAILPDQIGACAIADGCGVLVNKDDGSGGNWVTLPSGTHIQVKDGDVVKGPEGLKKGSASGAAKHDVKLPKNPKKMTIQQGEAALSQMGMKLGMLPTKLHEGKFMTSYEVTHPGGDKKTYSADALRKFIYSKATHNAAEDYGLPYWKRFLSVMGVNIKTLADYVENAEADTEIVANAASEPSKREGSPSVVTNQETLMDRKATIDFLVTNCDCWKGTGDREVLNGLTDEKLTTLKAGAEKAQQAEAVANAAREGFGIPSTITVNAMPAFIKDAIAKKKAAEDAADGGADDDEEDDAGDKKGKKTVKNTATKPPTANEWLASAPPEIQSAVRNAMAIEQSERDRFIQRLTANLAGEAKQALVNRLSTKALDELKDLALLVPVRRDDVAPNYAGAAAPTGNHQVDESDVLEMPVYNWSEMAKQQRA